MGTYKDSLVTMYYTDRVLLLFTCYNIASTFYHNHKKGLGSLLKDMDQNLLQLHLSAIAMKWINQPLDHFDESETRTLEIRYFERMDFWNRGGPIYLIMTGEDAASTVFLETGTAYELAKETNGALFMSEHRYYGYSRPSIGNLKYLNSMQALADTARLLKQIKMSPQFHKSKVVVIGGSYSGNLAVWMRLMYPDLVDVAYASSAPVLAKANFFEYLETVGDGYKQYGTPGCFDKLRTKFQRYENLLQSDRGIYQLKMEKHICQRTDLKKLENKQLFFIIESSAYINNIQNTGLKSIQQICQQVTSSHHSIFSFGDGDDAVIWNEQMQCHDYDLDYYIRYLRESVDNTWLYQMCTEFGYFVTTSSADRHPFTNQITVEFHYKICSGIFGPEFGKQRVNEGIRKTNEMYGGVQPNVTHVIFVNGELDPWHRLGVLRDLSRDAVAIRIPLTAHCKDILSDSPHDPQELKQARRNIKKIIKKWIGAR